MSMTNSLSLGGSELLNRRWSLSIRVRAISSGLRVSTAHGPPGSPPRAFLYSSTAFFCAGVSLSTGMGGILPCALANAPKTSPNTNVPANRRTIVLVLPYAIGTSRHGVPAFGERSAVMLPEFYTPWPDLALDVSPAAYRHSK